MHLDVVRTVSGGLKSPALLVTVERIQRTKSDVLNAVSPSQPLPPTHLPSRDCQRVPLTPPPHTHKLTL